MPKSTEPYDNFFDCPIQWNSTHHQIIYDPDQANLPIIFADKFNHAKVQAKLESKITKNLQQVRRQHWFIVSKLIRDSLPNILTLEAIAQQLNTSVRTLTRHLKKENTSYRDIFDEVRKTQARHLFEQGCTIQQVTSHLGYKDCAAFSRAFYRWHQENPGAYIKKISFKTKI